MAHIRHCGQKEDYPLEMGGVRSVSWDLLPKYQPFDTHEGLREHVSLLRTNQASHGIPLRTIWQGSNASSHSGSRSGRFLCTLEAFHEKSSFI